MKNLKCTCCGANINPITYVCDYCGAKYKKEPDDNIIQIETYNKPFENIYAIIEVPEEAFNDPNTNMEIVIREKLVTELARKIVKYTKIDTDFDVINWTKKYMAVIKVVTED